MRPSAFAVLRLMTIKYFVWQLDGEFSRLRARKNLINIASRSTKYILEVRPVRKETAVSGDNGCLVDRRNIVPRCQRYDYRAVDPDKIVWHPGRPL